MIMIRSNEYPERVLDWVLVVLGLVVLEYLDVHEQVTSQRLIVFICCKMGLDQMLGKHGPLSHIDCNSRWDSATLAAAYLWGH